MIYLFIGITNPDPKATKSDKTDLHRSLPISNPCTYYERYLMIQGALFEKGYKSNQFCIVPFPINFPELWHYYVPQDATYFVAIYDEWEERKLAMFLSYGLKTEILFKKNIEEKQISGTMVRQFIADNGTWEKFVPKQTIKIINEFGIEERIKNLYNIVN